MARPAITARQFQRLSIPPQAIHTQPAPAQLILINIPANLYVPAEPAVLTTTVLGQPIRVRATPVRYAWAYGDGQHTTTTDPGSPYPRMSTPHTYTHPGRYTIRLATTYTGQYSVGGGPWQPITGTATVPSPPVTITTTEARAHLVSSNTG